MTGVATDTMQVKISKSSAHRFLCYCWPATQVSGKDSYVIWWSCMADAPAISSSTHWQHYERRPTQQSSCPFLPSKFSLSIIFVSSYLSSSLNPLAKSTSPN